MPSSPPPSFDPRMNKVNQAGAAVINRRLVVHLLREHGPLSRRQLAQRTGLRSSSLTYITRDLLDRGVIRTRGKLDRPGVGKKQVLLELDPDLGWVLGVGVEGDSAALVMLDCQGRVIDRDRMPLREPFDLMPQMLKARVDAWLARHGRPAGRLLGLGLGMPAVIDPDRGVVLRSTRFQLENDPLGERLVQAFDTPVFLDNDSNFAALAESRQGQARGVADFVYFLVNSNERGDRYAVHGLGSSLFVNGALYRGAHFGAGEIDRLLEGENAEAVNAAELLAIASPEGELTDPLRHLGDRLADILAVIVDLLDSSLIVIGGNLGLSNRRLIEHMQGRLNERIVPVPRRDVAVRTSQFMDHGVSMGAALAALDGVLMAGEAEANGREHTTDDGVDEQSGVGADADHHDADHHDTDHHDTDAAARRSRVGRGGARVLAPQTTMLQQADADATGGAR